MPLGSEPRAHRSRPGRAGVLVAFAGATALGLVLAATVAPWIVERIAPIAAAQASVTADTTTAALDPLRAQGQRARIERPRSATEDRAASLPAAHAPIREDASSTRDPRTAHDRGAHLERPRSATEDRAASLPAAHAPIREDATRDAASVSEAGVTRAALPIPASDEEPAPATSPASRADDHELGAQTLLTHRARAIETAPPTERAVGIDRPALGPLDPEAVRTVIRGGQHRLRQCYETALRRHGLATDAAMSLTIHIDPEGFVTDAVVEGPDFGGLARCLRFTAFRWRFPPSSEGGRVPIPLAFRFVD